jgi:hypothetical protein
MDQLSTLSASSSASMGSLENERGDIKAGKGPLIAAASEYLVMGELLRRGWIAGLTPRGTADFDVVAIEKDCPIRVRVKTNTINSKLFRRNRGAEGKALREPLGEDDFCILVDLAGEHDIPEYFNPSLLPPSRGKRITAKHSLQGSAQSQTNIEPWICCWDKFPRWPGLFLKASPLL